MICIACPRSKNGKTRRLWPYWQGRLAAAGVDVEWVETERAGHATEIARDATGPVVAVGGDGTINEVLNGLLGSGSSQSLGILYAGTSPDFCRFHQIPTDPCAAMDTLLAGKSKPVDTVRVKHADTSGVMKEAYFACSASVGFGAAVARFSNRYRKFLGDFPGTLAGVLRAFVLNRPSDLVVELDGQEHHFRRCNHLMLVKNPHIASGLRLDLPIEPDDGRAYLLAVHDRGRLGLCRELPKFYTGHVAESPTIFIRPFTRVVVSVNEPKSTEVEYDGDPRGFLPLEAELMSKNLNLCISYGSVS